MSNEHQLLLCGPFNVTDMAGRTWRVESIFIFDEGYGPINVHVTLELPADEGLHEDQAVLRQLMARLRLLGYVGPDFGLGAEDLQYELLIVLEASEEFELFAATRGWKNLADEYLDDEAEQRVAMAEINAAAVYSALMGRLRSN